MYAWVVRVGTCSVPRLAGVSATCPPFRSKTAADVLRERSSLVNCWERMSARSAAAGRLALALRKAVKTALYSLASTSALVRNSTSRAAKYWATPPASSSTARRPKYRNVSRQRSERKRDMTSRAGRGATHGSCLDPVPNSPDRLDQLVLLIAEFLPKVPDVDLDVVPFVVDDQHPRAARGRRLGGGFCHFESQYNGTFGEIPSCRRLLRRLSVSSC